MEELDLQAQRNLDKAVFYEKLARRPLIEIVQEAEEETYWKKQFDSSNDITLYSWRNDWLANMKANFEHFGYFNRSHSVKVFFNELTANPVVLVGAGPSLAKNIEYLKLAKELSIPILVSHHVLMYLSKEEYRIKPDFVCCLDAGKQWQEYFGDLDFFSDVPLLVDQCCAAEQVKAWKGPVYFFRSSMPDSNIGKMLKMELERICPMTKWGSVLEVGGHAMGAMLSLARGIMNSSQIIFAGSDYCYEGDNFYPFDHPIDKSWLGEDGKNHRSRPPAHGYIFDILGSQVASSAAYLGFKNVMDAGLRIHSLSAMQGGQELDFYNCTEGGALGALKGGNSKWMKYLRLEDALYAVSEKQKLKEVKT